MSKENIINIAYLVLMVNVIGFACGLVINVIYSVFKK